MAKSRHYIPTSSNNVRAFKAELNNLKKRIDQHKKDLKAIQLAYDTQMDCLANFARHDMGNAIQNISASIRALKGKVEEEYINELNASVNSLSETLKNFGVLVPFSNDNTFLLPQLINAIEIMVRSSLKLENINFRCLVDKSDELEISQPFYPLLQVLHNLVINAKKAMNKEAPVKSIEIEANRDESYCVIKVKDTGKGIPKQNLNRIFDYGFTTTDGSGIGLFHAQSLCEKINGTISVDCSDGDFSTIFTIKFPIYGTQEDFSD